MSEDENSFSTSRGQINASLEEREANDSIIQKVKSRVSSILPTSLSKWFSPTTNSEENRNGNFRRRRCDDEEDENYLNDTNLNYSNLENNACNINLPPVKRSRLNCDEPTQFVSSIHKNKIGNNKFISSTPMLDIRGRKELHSEQSYSKPVFISPAARNLKPVEDINEETDIIEVVPQLLKSDLKRRSLNVPTISTSRYSSDRIYSDLNKNYGSNYIEKTEMPLKKSLEKTSIKNFEEQIENEDEDYEEDVAEEEDDEDEIDESENLNKSKINVKVSNGLSSNKNDTQDSASESEASQISGKQQETIFRNPAKRIRSSSVFNVNKDKSPIQKRENPNNNNMNGFNFYSHLEGKKSLFSSKNMYSVLNNSTLSLTSLNRRQQFNASLYGSTSALSDSRLLNTTSPFYKGATTYGGASAYGNSFMSSSARQIRITPTLIRPSSSLSNISNSSHDTSNTTHLGNDKYYNKISSVNASGSGNSAISSTAKRILELMDQFTTPLKDARKMADSLKTNQLQNKKRFTENDYIALRNNTINTGIKLQKPRTPYSRPRENLNQIESNSSMLPPVNELQVPSMAQLLQLKTLQANTERNRELATSNQKSLLNQRTDYKISQEISQKTDVNSNNTNTNKITTIQGGKMKNKITSTRPSKNLQQESVVIDPIELPDIPLPVMNSVPKIDIALPTKKPEIIISPPKPSSIQKVESPFSNKEKKSTTPVSNDAFKNFKFTSTTIKPPDSPVITTKVNENKDFEYKFSEPIKVNSISDPKSIVAINNFKFSSPIDVETYKKEIENLNRKNIIETPSKSIFSNDENKKASVPQLKTGSVLDALKNNPLPMSKNTTSGFGDAFKKPSNQWECSACMIRNDESRQKCIACETPRKNDTTKTNSLVSNTQNAAQKSTSLSEQLKQQFNPDTWECKVCMIRNKNEINSCLACNASKPGASKVTTDTKIVESQIKKPIDVGFKQIVAQQTSKWECSACMTRNDNDKLKCVCCEQAKPGASITSSSSTNTTTSSKFTFGIPPSSTPAEAVKPLDSGFKQIVAQQTAKWECTACMTRNDSNRTKCVCCEQAKPGSTASASTNATFSFGAAANKFTFGFNNKSDDKKTDDKTEDSKKEDNTSSGFKLGSTSTVTTNAFGTTTNSTFSFGFGSTTTKQEPTKTTSTLPTATVASEVKKDDSSKPATGTFSFGFTNKTSNEKTPETNTTTTAAEKPKFSFGTTASTIETKTSDEPDNKTKQFSFGVPTSNTTGFTLQPKTNTTAEANKVSSTSAGFSLITPQQQPQSTTSTTSTTTKTGFTFGSSTNPATTTTAASVFSAGTITSTSSQPAAATSFIFGSSKPLPSVTTATTSTTSIFGSSSSISTIANTSAATNLTNTTSVASAQTTSSFSSSFISSSSFDSPKSTSVLGNLGSPKNTFGSFSTNNTSGQAGATTTPSNNLFKFGSNTSSNTTTNNEKKPDTTTPVFGSSTTNSPANKSFSFGSSNATPTFGSSSGFNPIFGSSNANTNNNNTTASTNNSNNANGSKLFVFGPPKTDSNTTIASNSQLNSGAPVKTASSIFGMPSNNNENNKTNNNSTFGSASASPFGGNATFGSTQPQPQATGSIFGQTTTPSMPASSTNLFGNSSTFSQQKPAPPTFGSPSSSSTTTTNLFGSSSSISGNAAAATPSPFSSTSTNAGTFDVASSGLNASASTSGFGSQITPTFGSSTVNNSNSFNMPAATTDAKKANSTPFNFGAAPSQPAPSGGFSFGSNNNAVKPAFNFTAQSSPSFNFTGSSETSSNAPFTFNAPTPTTNIFAPQPSAPGNQTTLQARRKMRAAVRRTQPR